LLDILLPAARLGLFFAIRFRAVNAAAISSQKRLHAEAASRAAPERTKDAAQKTQSICVLRH
jgi:hypothetical protein